MNLKSRNQTSKISWRRNLVLGYLGQRKGHEILEFKNNLFQNHDLFFINYKNSMLGVGGVGTVTRALLKTIPDLNMICYDPNYVPTRYNSSKSGTNNVFPISLDSEESELFHGSYAKLYMWPVLHNQPSVIAESEVNSLHEVVSKCSKLFADKAIEASVGVKAPIFWVNDYNLSFVVAYLRQNAPDSKIIFSLRTPFGVNGLPNFFDKDAKMLIESLLKADILSFHRENDVLHFLDFVAKYSADDSRVKINWEDNTIEFNKHVTIPRAFPMGNDPDYRIALANNPASTVVKNEFKSITKGKIITSVSRFDRTKGLVFELDCIESLLRDNPDLKGKFTFLLISYLSDRKKSTQEYISFFHNVQKRILKINKKYGSNTWQPIIGKFDGQLNDIEMTGLFRATDILFIGSLGDGFNHMTVESVMSKTKTDSPIQIVTTNIGATDYLEGYNLVDSTDVIGSVEVIKSTLKKSSTNAISDFLKLRKSASKLYAYNWAMSIIQASIDITQVPIISKIIK